MPISPTGFTRQRLAEIKADFDRRFADALGPVNTAPDAVAGQVIGIFAAAMDDVQEAMEATYFAMYPASAEGTSLDGAVSFVGLQRLAAAPTTVVAVAYGSESALLPSGVLARSIDGKQYQSTQDALISRAGAIDAEIEVATVANSSVYQVILSGASFSFTSDASATGAEVIAGIAAAIGAAYVVTPSGAKLRIQAIDAATPFSLTVDTKLRITRIGSPVAMTAVELGAHELPIGALNRVESAIDGWDSVSNLKAGAKGRDVESDEALRDRHAQSVRVAGAATVAAIRARIRAEVNSVSVVSVYENRGDAPDAFGLPGHSIEVVVVGGADAAVAQKLFEVKPAGIETYGNTAVLVDDENGDGQLTSFSRATPTYAWVRVTVNALNPEEPLSGAAVAAIKAAVLAYGAQIGIGNDVYPQRLFGPIYGSTTGIGAITVEVAKTATESGPPTYATTPLAIGRAEFAEFADARVVVAGIA